VHLLRRTQETEWHYESATRLVHLWPKEGRDPNGLDVRARVQEYALAITDSSGLSVQGLHFFATTVYAAGEGLNNDIRDITFDSLRFDFPSAQKRLLGDNDRSWPTTLLRKEKDDASGLVLFNCTFFGTDTHPLINLGSSSGLLIDNNLFEWNDWSAVTTRPVRYFAGTLENFGMGAFTLSVPKSEVVENRTLLRRNTIRHNGASATVNRGARNVDTELNHIWDQYALQSAWRGRVEPAHQGMRSLCMPPRTRASRRLCERPLREGGL
jgi:hypothetical protein